MVAGEADRWAARDVVVAYHAAQLDELVEHVGGVIDRYRAGQIDAFEVDQALFQYSRAAKELWKYCNLIDAEIIADEIRQQLLADWWERGAPKKR